MEKYLGTQSYLLLFNFASPFSPVLHIIFTITIFNFQYIYIIYLFFLKGYYTSSVLIKKQNNNLLTQTIYALSHRGTVRKLLTTLFYF